MKIINHDLSISPFILSDMLMIVPCQYLLFIYPHKFLQTPIVLFEPAEWSLCLYQFLFKPLLFFCSNNQASLFIFKFIDSVFHETQLLLYLEQSCFSSSSCLCFIIFFFVELPLLFLELEQFFRIWWMWRVTFYIDKVVIDNSCRHKVILLDKCPHIFTKLLILWG